MTASAGISGRDLAEEYWSWRGTPFRWQASLKGVACDCKGMIRGAAAALGRPEADSLHARFSEYGAVVPVGLLKQGLADLFDRVPGDVPADGDVVLMLTGRPRRAQHLGGIARGHVVHAYPQGPAQVIATELAVARRAWPFDSVWRFRGLEAGEAAHG